MIELKNVKKTYKSQKGFPTEALNGIDLQLGDRGITFVLGKSGSGKSTLLSIIGGLEDYTSGEITINGKSTTEFKEGDWDAYRNTYMGFIFQDFNLLDNYTIEDNVRLSLELQNKNVSSQEILDALKQVDLDDILKRKPNELSGGQKQRVAIARALIKNPEIILADEPTGNVDAATCEHIFQILKKLSKDKLIIIVSHDEEAAKKYGDRIIRLKDGIIESDEGEKFLTEKKELNLVHAKLPFGFSFKRGLGNLFRRKLRFTISALTIVACLTCFGLTVATLNTDLNQEYINRFEENKNTEISVKKYEEEVVYEDIFANVIGHIFDHNYDYKNSYPKTAFMDDDFVKEVEEKTNLKWNKEYNVYNNSESILWNYTSSVSVNDPIYYNIGDLSSGRGISLVEITEQNKENWKIIGNLPEKEDEVIISSFIADQIMFRGIEARVDKKANLTTIYKPNSYQQIINDDLYIYLGDWMYVKVVGIADFSDYINENYAELKDTKVSSWYDMNTHDSKYNEIDNLYAKLVSDCTTLFKRIYVSNQFIDHLDTNEFNISSSSSKIISDYDMIYIDGFGYISKEQNIITENGIVTIDHLNENEMLINLETLDLITKQDFSKKFITASNQTQFIIDYLKEHKIIGKSIKSSINHNKNYSDTSSFADYKIIGIIDDQKDSSYTYYRKVHVQNLVTRNVELDHVFTRINTIDELKGILDDYPINRSAILSSSSYSQHLLDSILISHILNLAGKYGAVFFLTFAILLLMNFINNSIRVRRKEIGILRAIGCTSNDIIKMFMVECGTLMLICLTITFIILPRIISFINTFITSTLYIDVQILKFGLLPALCVLIAMVFITLLASMLPLQRLTKMKPIDTMLDI